MFILLLLLLLFFQYFKDITPLSSGLHILQEGRCYYYFYSSVCNSSDFSISPQDFLLFLVINNLTTVCLEVFFCVLILLGVL